MEKHNNKFFTMWYGVYNKKTRMLTYSSGGHPPVVYFEGKSSENVKPQELQTAGLVIGGMPGIEFEKKTLEVKGEAHLYLYSDGVYEITKPDGKVLTLDEFIQVLSLPTPSGEDPLDRIQEYTQKLNGPGAYADDYSIIELVFS
jgi:sigma-B regulation protein RsbU (phosphoserine phosphatase)